MEKKITYSFRSMPPDVYRIVLKEQGNMKAKKGTSKFGIDQTIYAIIREWERCREGKP